MNAFTIILFIVLLTLGLTCIFNPKLIWSIFYAPSIKTKKQHYKGQIVLFGIFLTILGVIGLLLFIKDL